MTEKILVTYATCTGSTAGVAEAISKTLAEGGASVDLRPMREVTDLGTYRAVVAGSAVNGGEWLPEAKQFIQTHHMALSQKPFAAFLVCMTLAMPQAEKYRPFVSDYLKPVRSMVMPVSEGLFAGTLNLSKLPSLSDRLKFGVSVLLGIWKQGDHRDWNAIRTWAASLSSLLLH
ncbi:MAG: flavodoxin [Anaerolinea sp.]|nr:flavodoxin [Anaerolinea sp.]